MTTDEHSQDLIEAERMDVQQMIARASYWRGWCIDHEIEDAELVRLRYLIDAVLLHLYDVRDGRAAQKPTDDEREALIEQATWELIEWDTDTVDRGVRVEHYRDRRADIERVFPILAAGFRRPISPELSEHDDCKCGHLYRSEHSFATDACVTRECDCEVLHAESTDALDLVIHAERVGTERDDPLILELAEALRAALRAASGVQGAGNSAQNSGTSLRDHVRALTGLTDEVLDELGGFQGEPTDAQVLAALKAFYGEKKAVHMWDRREDMRAALRAAAEITKSEKGGAER